MTEEDTFDRLRRPPIKEMIQLWRDDPMVEDDAAFYKSYGWDIDDAQAAWIALIK